MPTCIYTGQPFENASAEHILQNFLGARWTSNTIVCDAAQEAFGETIDAAFESGMRPVRNLLGTKGGRGENAPPIKRLSAASGEIIDLEAGGKPRLNRPIVSVKKNASGEDYEVNIQIGDKKQAGWALAELRKEIPGIQITEEEVLQLGRAQPSYIQGPVKVEIRLGGTNYIRGVIKSCFNLLGVNGINVFDSYFDPVRAFVLKGEGASSDFLRWPKRDGDITLPKLGPIDHFVGIASRGPTVEGIVRLFGGIGHAICLTKTYSGRPFRVGYLVNPLRDPLPAEERNPVFDGNLLPDFNSQPDSPGSESREAMSYAISRVGSVYFECSQEEMVNETVKEVLLPHDGKLFSQEMVSELSRKIARRVLRLDED